MVQRPAIQFLVFAITMLTAVAGPAVIIATGDGTGNSTAPANDPGWANVGTRTTGLTVVYLGNGWVLTANHVGVGDVVLAGQTYSAVSGTERQIVNPDGTGADLVLFQINGRPNLPYLPIAPLGPPTTTSIVTLIGAGVNRGPATSWNGIDGFLWGGSTTMRWGTAPVVQVGTALSLNGYVTHGFATVFTNVGTTAFPAQAALGDSGGAAFLNVNGTWMLVGVLFAVGEYSNQPAGTSLFGDYTYAADLSFYRGQIVPVVTPGCGFGAELGLLMPPLLWLHRRRHR
jgi:hypothetical protein